MRSKTKTLPKKVTSIDDLPSWNYDGSSTGQAVTENSEVVIKPRAFFPDPFRGGDNILVLCDTYNWTEGFKDKKPANTNFRYFAQKILEKAADRKPWFGLE